MRTNLKTVLSSTTHRNVRVFLCLFQFAVFAHNFFGADLFEGDSQHHVVAHRGAGLYHTNTKRGVLDRIPYLPFANGRRCFRLGLRRHPRGACRRRQILRVILIRRHHAAVVALTNGRTTVVAAVRAAAGASSTKIRAAPRAIGGLFGFLFQLIRNGA